MKLRRDSTVNGITEGVIWKEILIFFFPILFGTFFQQLYNTVDAMVVGRFVGATALAAVGGSTGNLINLLVGFFVGLSSGATVIIAQFWGRKDYSGVSRAVHTAIAFSVVGGAVIMVFGILSARMLLSWMNTPEDMMDASVSYMRIIFAGLIPSMIYNIGSGILRAVGDSRRPLVFLIVSSLINVVGDLFCVCVLKMGIEGAAVATIFSQAVSAVLVLITLRRAENATHLIWKEVRLHGDTLLEIIKIGLPTGLQSVMYSISNVLLQSAVNTFGTVTLAANTAYGKLDGIYWMISGAFGVTVTTFVGQNFGARKFDRMFKCVRITLLMALFNTLLLCSLLFFGGQFVFPLFTNDPQVLSEAVHICKNMCFFFILHVPMSILSGTLNGTGDTLAPMIMSALSICLLRMVWVWTVVPHVSSILGVLQSYPITWTAGSLMLTFYYLPKKWLERRKAAVGYLESEKKNS